VEVPVPWVVLSCLRNIKRYMSCASDMLASWSSGHHVVSRCSSPGSQPPSWGPDGRVDPPAWRLPSLAAALGLLVAQPGLLYDVTPASIAARLEQLGVVLACTADEARELALQ